MNGSTGFGLSAGGQYGLIEDVEIKNVTGTRIDDADQGKIALIIPGSTLWDINGLSILNCANHIYVGFSGENPSAPSQYINFQGLRTDSATSGFSIKIRYGTGVNFNGLYLEGAPDKIIQLINSNSIHFDNFTCEIDGNHPLLSSSHILVKNCINSHGAPSGKDLFELGESVNSFTLNRSTIIARESMRDIVRSTAESVLPDNVSIKTCLNYAPVSGKSIETTISGRYNSFSGRDIAGAPMRASSLMTEIHGCGSDAYITTGSGHVARVSVAASNKIFINDCELTGMRNYP